MVGEIYGIAPKRGCWLATCLNCRVKSLFGLY